MLTIFFVGAVMMTPVEQIHGELKSLSPKSHTERSRLLFFLGKHSAEDEAKDKAFAESLEAATKARAADPKDPGAIIWWIAAKSEVVVRKEGKFAALPWIRKFEEELLELRRWAPDYNYHAADRVLGYLYYKVPPIISIGSKSKARTHLKAAYDGAPAFPGNQLFYAEFLLDQGEEEKARDLAQKIVEGTELTKFPIERAEWTEAANRILKSTEKRSYSIPFGFGNSK